MEAPLHKFCGTRHWSKEPCPAMKDHSRESGARRNDVESIVHRAPPAPRLKSPAGVKTRTRGVAVMKSSGGSSAVESRPSKPLVEGSTPSPRSKLAAKAVKKSTAAPVSEPRKGRSVPGKGASRTVPQVSHADNREAVTGAHRESGETDLRDTGGRQLQPALRTEVALGAADVPLTKRGTPRQRAPKGSFDRKANHREFMRKSRAAKAAKEPK